MIYQEKIQGANFKGEKVIEKHTVYENKGKDIQKKTHER